MGYYNDRDMDNERQQYEDWHRYGSERGFFDRVSDEVKSWFGDEDAEQRRRQDQNESYGPGREQRQSGRQNGERPDWQRRDYSGPSPRGSRIDERSRYDEPEQMGSRRGLRGWEGRGRFGQGYGYESQSGGWGSERSGLRRESEYDRPSYGREEGFGGWGDRNRERNRGWFGNQSWQERQQRPRFFDRDRDMETGMSWGPYASDRYNRGDFDRDYENRFGGDYGPNVRERGMMGGGFSGRGPRNYTRSDERISDEINQFLTMHPEIDASDIDVIVEQGIVTLKGRVDDRQSKRMAEELAEDVYGVKEVHNEIRIDKMNRTNNNVDQFGRTPNMLNR